jgi:hypothetical protein
VGRVAFQGFIMSLRNLFESARAAHTSFFGGSVVKYTIPGANAVTWSTARPHRERLETRQTETGNQRIAAREIHVDETEVAAIRTDAVIEVDGVSYAIEGHWLLRSGQHVVRIRRTLAAEVSRPRYRGNTARRPPNY